MSVPHRWPVPHRWIVAPAAAALLFLLAAVMVAAQPAPPGDHLATGLEHPRGLTVDGDDILVSEVGGGRVLRIAADGTVSDEVVGLPTGVFFSEAADAEEVAGPSASAVLPEGLAILTSENPDDPAFQSVHFVPPGGEAVKFADLGEYEAEHNTDGGVNPDGTPDLLSNPYAILPDGEGGLFVGDAGANAILRISADGEISPYAVLAARDNPLFPDLGGPEMDQVPTGMTIGPDGALYVATLTGFPFPQGEAVIYRVSGGELTVYATGLTVVTDIAFDSSGDLYAVEFSTNMLAGEPGRLVRATSGGPEVLVEGLVSPTALAITADDRFIVSQEFAGLVSDLTGAIGEPAPVDPAPEEPADPDEPGAPEQPADPGKPADPPPAEDPLPDPPLPADTGTGMSGASSTDPGLLPWLAALIAGAVVLGLRRVTRPAR